MAYDENTGETRDDLKKIYYSKMYNPFINLSNTLHYMIHLQEFCKARNIKLLYWNAMLPTVDDGSLSKYASKAFMSRKDSHTEEQGLRHNFKKLKSMIAKLDSTLWIHKPWYGINDHTKELPKLSDGHPGPEASAAWAELVKKHL